MDSGFADLLFDGLVEINTQGRVTTWNKAAEQITGFAASKIIGQLYRRQPARQVRENGADLPEAQDLLLMTVQDGHAREALAYVNHAEGYQKCIIARTSPVFSSEGRICGAFQLFNDNRTLIGAFRANQLTEQTIRLDPLTGIGNRPHIEARIKAAIADYRSRKCPFGILFIDVDHFKDFNDTYGHLLGDKILRVAANTLRHNLRGSDSCGRWGGEEFIAIVHGLDRAGLSSVAEKLRKSVADANMREKGQGLSITISIGASLVRPTDDYQTLVERADRLMYESKRRGRNLVTVDDPSSAEA